MQSPTAFGGRSVSAVTVEEHHHRSAHESSEDIASLLQHSRRSGRTHRRSARVKRLSPLRQPRESVRAPLFTPNPVMDKEQTIGIVLLLDGAELRIIGSPMCFLPRTIEVVALRNI